MNSNTQGNIHRISNKLSERGKKVTVFDKLQSNLISLGQLCDDNCEVTLNKHKLKVIQDNKLIM